jgi:uncharacterized membrane protein
MQNSYGKSVFDLDANVVALLCYLGNLVCMLGLVLSIVTVVTDKKNKLARFHAWQSILLSIFPIIVIFIWVIVSVVGSILGTVIDVAIGFPIFTLIIFVISMIIYLLMIIASLVLLVGEIIGAIKAYNGELFKLPIIGKMADKYSG